MSQQRQRQQDDERTDGQEQQPGGGSDGSERQSVARSLPFRLGRLLLGGALAFMAFDNLRQLEGRIAYAESQGAPKPDVTVPLVSGLLQAGSIGVVLWRLPKFSTAAIAAFFLSVTPVMHDFWTKEDEQEQQQQMVHFLKNTALLGAALALLGLGRRNG